jgi:hypothetical protein
MPSQTDATTIWLHRSTHETLKELKGDPEETFDSLVNDLLKEAGRDVSEGGS